MLRDYVLLVTHRNGAERTAVAESSVAKPPADGDKGLEVARRSKVYSR